MQYHRWSYTLIRAETGILLPDGCRDVVVRTDRDGTIRSTLTSLDMAPRTTCLSVGTCLQGIRLRPGTDVTSLIAHLPELSSTAIDTFLPTDPELCELVAAMACPEMTPARLARRAGTSLRTVQRHLRQKGQPPLRFWQQLGRARFTASRLSVHSDLADLACSGGYADQAHMTRSFTRWFGLTPARLARRPDLLSQIAQSGLGTWTAEQISTR